MHLTSGGGIENSLSLLELFKILEDLLGIKMDYKRIQERESDQLVFVADNSKIINASGWRPVVKTRDGIAQYMNWLSQD